jgi:hypothetical protein
MSAATSDDGSAGDELIEPTDAFRPDAADAADTEMKDRSEGENCGDLSVMVGVPATNG